MKPKYSNGTIPEASSARGYNGERGESLVGVMIAVAISGIAAAGVSAAIGHVMQSQNALKASQSMNKFQDSLRSGVSTVARTFAATGCGTVACNPTTTDPLYNSICTALGGTSAGGTAGTGNTPSLSSSYSSIFSSSNLSLPLLNASLSYTTSVTPPTSPYISSSDGAMGQAAARCSTPVKAGALGSGEYYRFCLNVNRSTNSTVSADSFWNTTGNSATTFIELMMIPVTLPSDTPITCSTFGNSKQNGIKVLYTVWRYKKLKASASSPSDVKHEDGLFYITGLDVPPPPPPAPQPDVWCAQGPAGRVNIVTLDQTEANNCRDDANGAGFFMGRTCSGDTSARLSVTNCNQLRRYVPWYHRSYTANGNKCVRFNPLKCFQAAPNLWNP